MMLFQQAVETAFWLCIGLVFDAYFVFPLLIWSLSSFFGRRCKSAAEKFQDLPAQLAKMADEVPMAGV